MRFLVVAKSKHPTPPDIATGVHDAGSAWADKYAANKKMEQIWGFAGMMGSGGILSVNSLEELDAIMAEFPFGPFSETEIYPLTELHGKLQRAKQAMQSMAPGGKR